MYYGKPTAGLSVILFQFCSNVGLNRDLRNEMGKLTGEKASLEREVEKLRDEVTIKFIFLKISLCVRYMLMCSGCGQML